MGRDLRQAMQVIIDACHEREVSLMSSIESLKRRTGRTRARGGRDYGVDVEGKGLAKVSSGGSSHSGGTSGGMPRAKPPGLSFFLPGRDAKYCTVPPS